MADTLPLVLGILTIFMFSLTYLVVRKDRFYVNITFATAPAAVGLNTLMGVLVLGFGIAPLVLTPIAFLLQTVGSLGFILAGLFIIYGREIYKDVLVVLFILGYTLLAVLAIINNQLILMEDTAAIAGTAWIYLLSAVSFGVAGVVFTKVGLVITKNQREITILVIGFVLLFIAQFTRGLSILLYDVEFFPGQAFLVIGMFLSVVAFTRVKSGSQTSNNTSISPSIS